MSTQKRTDFITIETLEKIVDERGNGRKVRIVAHYTPQYQKEADGLYTFFIRAYDISFTATSIEEGRNICRSAINAFLAYWGESSSKFMMRIRSLGFIPTSELWQTVLKKQRYANSSFTFPSKNAVKFGDVDTLMNRYHDSVEMTLA